MGFDPQTSDKPLVDVNKRTTKVNLSVAVGVIVFLIFGICVVVWAVKKESRGEPVKTPVESPK